MKLSNEDVQKALKALNDLKDVRGGITCPICKSNNKWDLNQTAFYLPSFQKKDGIFDFSYLEYMPAVACICGNCGYVAVFSSKVLGIDF